MLINVSKVTGLDLKGANQLIVLSVFYGLAPHSVLIHSLDPSFIKNIQFDFKIIGCKIIAGKPLRYPSSTRERRKKI